MLIQMDFLTTWKLAWLFWNCHTSLIHKLQRNFCSQRWGLSQLLCYYSVKILITSSGYCHLKLLLGRAWFNWGILTFSESIHNFSFRRFTRGLSLIRFMFWFVIGCKFLFEKFANLCWFLNRFYIWFCMRRPWVQLFCDGVCSSSLKLLSQICMCKCVLFVIMLFSSKIKSLCCAKLRAFKVFHRSDRGEAIHSVLPSVIWKHGLKLPLLDLFPLLPFNT